MAFDLDNFAPVNPSVAPVVLTTTGTGIRGAPRMWTYVTADAQTDVDAAGYFNAAAAYQGAYNMLEIGDLIYVVTVTGAGAFSQAGLVIVNAKASGTLDTTNVTVLTTTDSD